MRQKVLGMAAVAAVMLASGAAQAGIQPDIANTKHNLSSRPYTLGVDDRTVKATSETQLCVFCHTPHQAENIPAAPLWNRKLSTATYTLYNSSSMDALDSNTQPTAASSKLCLSCHDGTLAIGAVNVLNGAYTDRNPATADINMAGTGTGGVMPSGSGSTTGYTRNLGTDLTNDHPISFTYNATLAAADGDLANPASAVGVTISNPSIGFRPDLPLNNNRVECATCHDPHVRDTDPTKDIKFLRLNRFQTNSGPSGAFSKTNDIICLACHTKDGWVDSAHANPNVANELYTTTASSQREFFSGIRVWEAACLNCHDTHTVQGARRLLREGTDSPLKPKAGGNAALEQVCYQCHSAQADGNTLTVQGDNTEVPDIKTDFTAMARRMPIASSEQDAGTEVHSIGTANADVPTQRGKELIESPSLLGKGNLANRHAECTDCHNPHRVIRNRLITSNPTLPDAGGTHSHVGITTPHTNIASGVLRGTWGVEPVYGSSEFTQIPTSFIVKYGMPPANNNPNPPVSEPYVTREYQLCLKCHSNYAYDDLSGIGGFEYGGRPLLGSPGTPATRTNDPRTHTRYTNQAMEFQAPAGHDADGTAAGTGARTGSWSCSFSGGGGGGMGGGGGGGGGMGSSSFSGTCNATNNNHRGWHPVMAATGRTPAIRSIAAGSTDIFLPPWDIGMGTQTMYCTDCHGSSVEGATGVPIAGENGNPWGPHGSNYDFLLKGRWNTLTGSGQAPEGLCFKCHNYNDYSCGGTESSGGGGMGWSHMGGGGMGMGTTCPSSPNDSGFSSTINNNLHVFHNQVIGKMRCNWCHAAVPHGWKNKALLVNILDIGPEVGMPVGTQAASIPYTRGPYYRNAMLPVVTFAPSGLWTANNCGGQSWMWGSCNNPP